MFSISSAPEKYQRIISDVIRGCKGVANIADDVTVHGKDAGEHDKNLRFCSFTVPEREGFDLKCNQVSFQITQVDIFRT